MSGLLDSQSYWAEDLGPWVISEAVSLGGGRGPLTCTDDACVLLVGADVGLPAAVGAEAQLLLTAPAGQLAQPHGPRALPEEGASGGGQRAPAAQLAAGHSGVPQVPAVVAHGAPAPAVPHLQAARAPVGAIGQTQPLWGGQRKGCDVLETLGPGGAYGLGAVLQGITGRPVSWLLTGSPTPGYPGEQWCPVGSRKPSPRWSWGKWCPRS